MAAIIERCRLEGDHLLLEVVEQHREVLRAYRERGVAAAVAALKAVSVPKAGQDESFTRVAAETVFARSPADLRALIEQYEDLVSPAGIATMQELLAVAREHSDAAAVPAPQTACS